MAFAKISEDLSYWQKQSQPLFENLLWNIPEQKSGKVAIIGGNSQGFRSTIQLAENLNKEFPLGSLKILLPDALQGKLPPLPDIDFAPSTPSGSFAKSSAISQTMENSDFVILPGDLSHNSITSVAILEALIPEDQSNTRPAIIARDAVDTLAASAAALLTHPNLFIFASMTQLQKLFRNVYYPKMLMLSAPIVPIIEALHKFTISYPATLITFHEGQIIVASHGEIISTKLADTKYSMLTLWDGTLVGKIAGLNLYNPNHPLEATAAAILSE